MCDGVLRHVSSIELIPFPSLWNNEQGRGFRLISNFKQDKQCMEDDSLELKESRDFLEIIFPSFSFLWHPVFSILPFIPATTR